MPSKKIAAVSVIIFILALAPFVGADAITPGYHTISVINKITNLQDFSGYDIISIGSLGPGMCPPKVIGSDGIVTGYYKFCSVSLYAVNESGYAALPENSTIQSNYTKTNGILLATGIITSMSVSDSNLATNITTRIALHSGTVITPNYLIYLPSLQSELILIALSMIGLIAIVLILYCKKRRHSRGRK